MPYTDTPDPMIATITDTGRTYLARAILGEISIKVKSFAVGRDGYIMSNPVHVLPIDPSLNTLIDQIFPAVGQKDILNTENPYPSTLVVNCKLLPTDVNSGLGELGLWAEVVNSVDPGEIGDLILFAVSHFPLITKTLKQSKLFRVVIQF